MTQTKIAVQFQVCSAKGPLLHGLDSMTADDSFSAQNLDKEHRECRLLFRLSQPFLGSFPSIRRAKLMHQYTHTILAVHIRPPFQSGKSGDFHPLRRILNKAVAQDTSLLRRPLLSYQRPGSSLCTFCRCFVRCLFNCLRGFTRLGWFQLGSPLVFLQTRVICL